MGSGKWEAGDGEQGGRVGFRCIKYIISREEQIVFSLRKIEVHNSKHWCLVFSGSFHSAMDMFTRAPMNLWKHQQV